MEGQITGGSLKTKIFAERHQKPSAHISLFSALPVTVFRDFISSHAIKLLNVAGSRESKEPGVYEWARAILFDALNPKVDSLARSAKDSS